MDLGTPLRVGIAGYGLAGRFFHAPLVAATPGARVAAVVTRDPVRAEQARADHPGVAVHASVPDALAGGLDLLVVATTNDTHVPLARAAVEAGVAVVVDKPLAPDAASAAALVAQAEDAGVILTVFHNRRWDCDQLTLRRLMGSGELGEVLRYESRFERWRPQLDTGKWREVRPAAAGGGLLLDLGTHLVDQAVTLFGPVAAVYAEIDQRRGGADDDVFVALTHASGVRAHLWAGALAGSPGPRLRVLGTAGAFVVPELDSQEEALRAGRRPDDGADWGVEPAGRCGWLVRGEESVPVPSERGRWDTFYLGVVAALREGAPVPVPARDAVTVLELLEAARASAAGGTVVRVG